MSVENSNQANTSQTNNNQKSNTNKVNHENDNTIYSAYEQNVQKYFENIRKNSPQYFRSPT